MKKNNLIKRYFLLVSHAPIFINFLIFVVGLLIIFCFDEFRNNVNTGNLTPEARDWLRYLAIILFTHTVIIYIVIEMFISRYTKGMFGDGDSPRNRLGTILVMKTGKKIIFKKQVWGKGKECFIVSPDTHSTEKGGEMTFSTGISTNYKNSQIYIPVKLKLELSGEWDVIKLFETLSKEQKDTDYPDLYVYVANVFKKINQSSQEAINEAAKEYSQLKISAPEFLDRVIELIAFPENLFPNVTDVKICLGQPETSSCKGMACGSQND